MINQSSQNFASTQGDGDESINISAMVSTLWRGKWIIALVTAIAVFLAGYYAYSVAVPLYRSTAVVILETQQDKVVDLQAVVGGFSGDATAVNT